MEHVQIEVPTGDASDGGASRTAEKIGQSSLYVTSLQAPICWMLGSVTGREGAEAAAILGYD